MWSIPDDVDEELFIKAFSGERLVGDSSKDTAPCSAIIHPNTGLRQGTCREFLHFARAPVPENDRTFTSARAYLEWPGRNEFYR